MSATKFAVGGYKSAVPAGLKPARNDLREHDGAWLKVYIRPRAGEAREFEVPAEAFATTAESVYVFAVGSPGRWFWPDVAEIMVKPM